MRMSSVDAMKQRTKKLSLVKYFPLPFIFKQMFLIKNNFHFNYFSPLSSPVPTILILELKPLTSNGLNSTTFNYNQNLIPIKDGENYEFWSIQNENPFLSPRPLGNSTRRDKQNRIKGE